jgi:uncharacterized protein
MNLDYEWDPKKYHQNLKKHGVRFEDAILIWMDPFANEYLDEVNSEAEERFIRIGLNPLKGILMVVFCERHESIIRIISARFATSKEIEDYERRV